MGKRVLIAIDSFKGCLSSRQIGEAVAKAFAESGAQTTVMPVADGGEGTVEALEHAVGGVWRTVRASAPNSKYAPVRARYLFDRQTATAYIEVAAASGLTLVPEKRRNVSASSTLGTGQLIADALRIGARHIVMGLGGSATCDAGMGVMAALGVIFRDENDNALPPCGANLSRIRRIDTAGLFPQARAARYDLIYDVAAPLTGPNGAAQLFAPQKGASPEEVQALENGLKNIRRLVGRAAHRKGIGAAGGIGVLMCRYLHAHMYVGANYILRRCGFGKALRQCDLVVTGEGRIDRQTLLGKLPFLVAKQARERNVPVIAVCGSVADDFPLESSPFEAVLPITPPDMPLREAMRSSVARTNARAAILRYLAR